MRWKRNTGFDQIEDRRGQGGGSIGFPILQQFNLFSTAHMEVSRVP